MSNAAWWDGSAARRGDNRDQADQTQWSRGQAQRYSQAVQSLARVSLTGALLGAALVCVEQRAQAEGLGEDLYDARSVGRAGTSVVSGDSGATLISNPGGMVRRSNQRLVLSTSIVDADLRYQAADAPNSPSIINRGAPAMAPALAYHRGNANGTWVLGMALMRGSTNLELPIPAFGQPAADVQQLFPHRYGGTTLRLDWHRVAIGGAVRIGESIGLGLSASLAKIELEERRTIWAGFAGRDTLLSPERDMDLQLSARDLFNPGASLGALIAPPQIPLEFALSVEFSWGARLRHRTASLSPTSIESFPQSVMRTPQADLDLPHSLTARTGVRYLGKHVFVELQAQTRVLQERSQPEWSIAGLEVVDQTGATASVDSLPSLIHGRTSTSLRGAIDYELISGYLWLTGGYAWTSPASPRNWLKPGYAQLGGHMTAIGIDLSYSEFTLNVGYARSLSRTRQVLRDESDSPVVNPFNAGSAASNAGSYQSSQDRLGFTLETSWQ